jgi:hypothetical protein
MARARFVTFNASDLIHDLDMLRRGFAELPPGLARVHIRAAMKRAMAPLMPMFRAAAPRRSGRLRRSVTTITKFDGSSGRFYSAVGFGRSKTKKGHHAILVADGTKPRYTRKRKRCGLIRPNPSMAALAAQVRASAPPEFEMQLAVALERAIRALPIYTARSRAGRG